MNLQQNLELRASGNSSLVPIISLSLFAVASGFLMSLIPLALKANNMSESLASWLASAFYAGLLAGSFISARIVGKLGHRVSLIAFLVLITATIVIMALFPSPMIWLIARFVAGAAVAGIFVAIESWLLIADTEKMRTKRLGIYMMALYGGSAMGQLGIGVFGTQGSLPLFIAASLMLSAMLAPLLIKRGQPPAICYSTIDVKEMRSLPWAAYIGCISSGLLIGAVYGLLPLELKASFKSEQIGSLMAVVIIGGMLVQPFVSWLSFRMEKTILMAFFCLLGILSIAMLEIATVSLGIIVGLFILGAAIFAFYPIAITLACQKLHQSKIVAATELMLLSYSIGSVVGPVLAGSSLNNTGSMLPFLFIVFGTTLIYMLIISKKYRRKAMLEQPDT